MRRNVPAPACRFPARAFRALLAALAAGILLCAANPAAAKNDPYDPVQAGNPIRISAYLLHPVGVLIDYGLMRPAFWLVQREPFSTIFGYQPPRKDDRTE